MKKVYIKNFAFKQTHETSFLVKHIALMESKDGKEYLNIILADSSGTIEARKWHGARVVVDSIKSGDIVNVSGKVNLFQSRLQFIIQDIEKVDNSKIDMSEFVATSSSSIDFMFEELLNLAEEIRDEKVKELIRSILFDPEISRRLKLWPAGKAIHHAYHGGLLEHTLNCAKLGKSVASQYKLNFDLVVGGLILHDLGKIYELSDGPLFEYTEEGRLVGHIVKSAEIFEKFVSKINDFPKVARAHLKHIILSHHGEYEYGTAKLPATKEAFVVHYVDQLDSKIFSIDEIIKNDKNQGNWSGYVKHLDRMIFKGDLSSFQEQSLAEPSRSAGQTKAKESKELKYTMADKLKDIKIK